MLSNLVMRHAARVSSFRNIKEVASDTNAYIIHKTLTNCHEISLVKETFLPQPLLLKKRQQTLLEIKVTRHWERGDRGGCRCRFITKTTFHFHDIASLKKLHVLDGFMIHH